jgi:signal transduction histidine kinase
VPAGLCDQLDARRGEFGVHNVYKYFWKERGATLNIAVAPLVSREGERIGRLIILDDVTDREELERRLMQADKLSSIGLLAAGVAHEVNTPLAVISTYAQMLAKQISDDAQKAPLLEKITRQTFRASEIVNSLLNFSRTSPTELGPVDLNKILRETGTLVEHQFAAAGIAADFTLEETLPRVRGNSGKLQQVFLNLFLNARDAMESGGRLSVTTSSNDGSVRVSVSDTGSGIAAENLPRIFDPFFTTKGAKRGTGLGLSVSYGIVREHGGDIAVESKLGQGSRFLLVFPQVAAPALKPAPEREIAAPAVAIAPVLSPALSANAAGAVSSQTVSAAEISAPASVPSVSVARSDTLIR